jgi:hypothetical protein
MATARQFFNSPIDIPISATGSIPLGDQNLQVANNVSIEFTNNATFPVNLVFTSQFGTINVLAGQSSAAITGSTLMVNYTIYNGLNNQPIGGPYSIQWGLGVLQISISSGVPTPQNITIAKQAKIQFTSDAAYPITWNPTNSFSPDPSPLTVGLNGAQAAVAAGQTVSYEFGTPGGVVRGGTVKVGS